MHIQIISDVCGRTSSILLTATKLPEGVTILRGVDGKLDIPFLEVSNPRHQSLEMQDSAKGKD